MRKGRFFGQKNCYFHSFPWQNPSAHLKRTCVFWEYEDPLNAWSSRGCHAIPEESTNEVTTCRCTHFTLFAVLLDPYNVEVNNNERHSLYSTMKSCNKEGLQVT